MGATVAGGRACRLPNQSFPDDTERAIWENPTAVINLSRADFHRLVQ